MVELEVRPAVVSGETRDGVRLISIHNPPVNALASAVAEALVTEIEAAEADGAISAVVITGSNGIFSGGADINEFRKHPPPGAKSVRDATAAIERAKKTFVAAIDGNAFGGGCEIAITCDYRLASAASRLGQPEIKLGLIPGAGGTQRLPRMLGAQIALDFMLKGDPKTAKQAKAMGLLDEIVEGDVVERALAFAKERAGSKNRASAKTFTVLPFMTAIAHGMVPAEDKGGFAAHKLIDAVEAASMLEFPFGLAREYRLFDELVVGEQAQAAIHLFFAERELNKVPGLSEGITPRTVAKAAVVGAGTMGSGIAMVFANAKIPVQVIDVSPEQVERGKKTVAETYEAQAKKGRMTAEEAKVRTEAVRFVGDYATIADVDLVVEAVFESMEVKKQVFAALDAALKPDAILASNTSTLDIDEIASATKRPDKVVGMHFFAPANIMQLLEVVRGKASSPETIVTALTLAKTLKKKGVLSGNAFGFIGNRMLFDYAREAMYLVEEGALPAQVDAVIRDFGFPLGPFQTFDLSGLDVFYKISLEAPQTRDRPSRLVNQLYEQGRYGQKTGAGFYRYEAGKRDAIPDPEVDAMIVAESKELGITRREISNQEILERCMYALSNQGAWLLGEGIALRPGDIDIVWIYGFGYPWYRGGPMWYADRVGTAKLYAKIVEFRDRFGDHWQPAPLLAELAATNATFESHTKVKV
ncbi:MAG TPA: 3-hydroxyacyl-CoA dehydrogenase NAD-binding domain-containing protein, partial [Candidatus Baltobacteraceae bacterium]|nr:3-hydroxyacyl-CoA dehydrogenase NAD-binding domain-containing protein [Candidatus Baltobacteraceae bacterium]